MSEFHNLLSRLNEKDILLSTPKMDNSNYTEALDFLTGRELSKLKRDALAEYQALERQLAEARATRYREITAIRTRFEVFIRGEWSAQEFRDYMKQLKEKGENE